MGIKKNIIQIEEQAVAGAPFYGMTQKTKDQIDNIEKEKNKEKENKKNFDLNYVILPIPQPNISNVKNLVIPKNQGRYDFYKSQAIPDNVFKSWKGTQYADKIPDKIISNTVNKLKSFVTPDNKWWVPTYRLNENNQGVFYWYCDNEELEFGNIVFYDQTNYVQISIPKEYVETWWDEWGTLTLTALSILAASLVPGMQGLLISAAIDMVVVAENLSEGDNIGAVVSTLLAFAPFLSTSIKGLGRFSTQEVKTVASKFARSENIDEVKAIYRKLSDKEKILVRGVLSQEPKQLIKAIDENIWKIYEENLKRGTWTARDVKNSLNDYIIKRKIPMPEVAKWWQKNPNLTKFGIDLGASGFILVGSYPFVKKEQEKKSLEDLQKNLLKPSFREPYELTPEDIKMMKSGYWEEDN